MYDTHHGSGRTALHELCRLTTFSTGFAVEHPEYSDEENDERNDPTSEINQDQFDMIELARLIIETSHILLQQPDTLTQYIVYSFEQSILIFKDINGNIPLHTLCENWNVNYEMMNLMFSLCDPNQSSKDKNIPTVGDLISHKNYLQCTPLHHISQCVCSFSALKLLLAQCSTGKDSILRVRDNDGETPLHWAFSAGVSKRRLELYLAKSKDLLYEKNNDNETPLFAIDIEDFPSARAMWQRVVLIMGVILEREYIAEPMFALAELSDLMPPSFINLGLRFYREELEDVDDHGRSPLHVAAMCPSRDLGDANFLTLLEHYPEAARHRCRKRRLPIHVALETAKSLDCVKALLAEYPEGLYEIDPVSQLPCFLLAGVVLEGCLPMVDNRLNSCYTLLREDPSVLRSSCL